MGLETFIVLCSSARTGSSLLCDYLGAGGIVTSELWVFKKPHFETVLTATQIAGYLNTKQDRARGINPIIHHFHQHSRPDNSNPATWLWTLVENVQAKKVVWLYLSRYDCIRQAISYARAHHLREWFSSGQPSDASDLDLSIEQIENRIANIHYQHNWWTAFFARYNLKPTRLFYEDFVADIPGTMARIFAEAGTGEYKTNAQTRKAQRSDDVQHLVNRYYEHLLEWSGLWSPEGKR